MAKIKEKIFKVLEKVLSYDIYMSIRIKYTHITSNKKEHYRLAYFHSKKKNCERKYCIFRFQMPEYMLLAVAIQYAFAYEWAVSKGFIPIMDVEFEYDYQRGRLGEDNLWEYCFQQPISVKEALKQEWVLVGAIGMNNYWLESTCRDINKKINDHYIHTTQENWREYYANVQKYIQKSWIFKDSILEKYERKYGCRIKQQKCVLGVFLRESFSSDTNKKRKKEVVDKVYKKHPEGPNVEEIIKIVKEKVIRWNCSAIFVSTMYEDSLNLFVEQFGAQVMFVDRQRQNLETAVFLPDIPDLWEMNAERKYNFYKKEKEPSYLYDMVVPYMEEIIGLSQCDYFIGPKSSGAVTALALNGGNYKDILILPDKNNIERY